MYMYSHTEQFRWQSQSNYAKPMFKIIVTNISFLKSSIYSPIASLELMYQPRVHAGFRLLLSPPPFDGISNLPQK
jgi:hypothetical protein